MSSASRPRPTSSPSRACSRRTPTRRGPRRLGRGVRQPACGHLRCQDNHAAQRRVGVRSSCRALRWPARPLGSSPRRRLQRGQHHPEPGRFVHHAGHVHPERHGAARGADLGHRAARPAARGPARSSCSAPGSSRSCRCRRLPVAYGNQLVGALIGPRGVVVRNTGTDTLHVGTATFGGTSPGQYTFGLNTCTGANLAPGGSCTVEVFFRPTALGAQSALLNVSSDVGTKSVALSGSGVANARGGHAGRSAAAAATGTPSPVRTAGRPPGRRLVACEAVADEPLRPDKVKRSKATKSGIRLTVRVKPGTKTLQIKVYRKTGSVRRLVSSGFKSAGKRLDAARHAEPPRAAPGLPGPGPLRGRGDARTQHDRPRHDHEARLQGRPLSRDENRAVASRPAPPAGRGPLTGRSSAAPTTMRRCRSTAPSSPPSSPAASRARSRAPRSPRACRTTRAAGRGRRSSSTSPARCCSAGSRRGWRAPTAAARCWEPASAGR